MKTLFCSRSRLRPKKACLRRVAQTVDGSNLIQKSRTCKRQCDRSSSKASQTLRTCKNHRPLCTRSFGSHTQEAPCILCHTKVHSRHNRYRTLAFGLPCWSPRAGVPVRCSGLPNPSPYPRKSCTRKSTILATADVGDRGRFGKILPIEFGIASKKRRELATFGEIGFRPRIRSGKPTSHQMRWERRRDSLLPTP